ncbi:MAG: rRNA maturation RNase YbeY [Spirochaetes bacterium GWD1_27_9]|nr:MAG: rRNA maturation RNase YbeY [Spirochaetes bacterium GWB1_27_13]OHD22906.1 MAG: rRNA maturation RNase YbeY [Spirochaetes bacterium GWC1_27_15]OHD43145.1 MAG: rRNA maturation RNase YbeY [Spirochaetes bacterium GWD1_27_9]
MKSFIDISYEKEEFFNIIKEKDVEKWIKKVLKELNLKNKSCSLFFCKDETIRELNKNYRNKDYVTDVLSFSQLEGDVIESSNFLGDIVLCVDQAIRQAKQYENDVLQEISFLILHSILHLLGHDHETDNGEMEELEKKIFLKLTGVVIE